VNLKLNRQFCAPPYRVALVGMILCLVFGMGGSSSAHARQAAAFPNQIYLPLVWRAPTTQTLTVNMSGTGSGTVTSNPTGINCGAICSASFNYNTSVTLSAVASTGSTFTGWSAGGCSGTGTCLVTMDTAMAVTATFMLSQNTYELRVGTSGNGTGTITSSPAGIDCGLICFYSFPYNTVVTLTATPTAPSVFTGWNEGLCSGTGTCQVTMNALRQVIAGFSIPCSGIANCDFESGSNGQWTEYSLQGNEIIYDCSDPSLCNEITPHGGVYLAWLGGDWLEISYIQQQVSIASSTPFLSYWQWIDSEDFCGYNYDYAEIFINGTQVDKYDLCTDTSTLEWVPHNVDLTNYEGQSVTLQIRVTTDDTNMSNLFVDDVNLLASPLTLATIPGNAPKQASMPTHGKNGAGTQK
jgi:hypothetical protein